MDTNTIKIWYTCTFVTTKFHLREREVSNSHDSLDKQTLCEVNSDIPVFYQHLGCVEVHWPY